MANTAVQLKILDNGVAVVTLDLPDSKVNLLGSQMMNELNAVIDQVAANSAVRGLVITSAKADNFVAGADINEIQSIQTQAPIEAYKASQMGKSVFQKIAELKIPVVAAIHGTCLGGGTELSVACGFRVASDSPKTKIGVPEVNLGFIPGWGGTVRLPRLLGLQTALDLILTGKTYDARKAWKTGLVDETVAEDKLLDRAIEVALTGKVRRFKAPLKARLTRAALEGNPIGRKIVNNMALKGVMAQTKGKYPAPIEALKVAMKAVTLPLDKAFEAESQAFARLAVSQVSRNLVGIFFAQQESKKTAVKPSRELKTVGVLGAGVMGAGIAQAAAYAGYKVILFDIKDEFVAKGLATIKGLFDSLVEKRKLTREEADALMANVSTTTTYDPFVAADFIIEAIPEDLNLKKKARTALEKVNPNAFIFATNTSSLSVSLMAEDARSPENVVGVHFFNPVYKMPLVEIVRGKATSDDTEALAKAFAGKLGKTTVTTADSPGFVVNRILAPYMREAIVMMESGVPLEDIEKAATSFGMPMGPLALLDEVGLDICAKVIHVLHDALGDRLAPPSILTSIEGLKLLGKKGGKGIYLYDEKGKRAGFNPDVLAAIKAPAQPKTRGEIQDRLYLAMLNEAVRCLEEGVISDPAQLDLAMIMGTGFPPFNGGVLRYADTTGVKVVLHKLDLLSTVAGENYRPCQLLREKAAAGTTFYRS